jgi:hypothetical protein
MMQQPAIAPSSSKSISPKLKQDEKRSLYSVQFSFDRLKTHQGQFLIPEVVGSKTLT